MWKFLAGGSFLFGQVSTDDAMLYKRFSTKNGAYINADFATGYVGVFDDGRMVTSQQSTVDGQTEIDQVSNLHGSRTMIMLLFIHLYTKSSIVSIDLILCNLIFIIYV